jgi:poly(hydroxyalkanoate) depolymerase family esterase
MLPRLLSLTALALLAAACAPDGSAADGTTQASTSTGITEITSFGSNPGQLKMYEHVPRGLRPNAPLVVVLHGCTQGAADIAQTGWNELADGNGFVVVYPEEQKNPVHCFAWAAGMGSADDVTRGKGENESVRQMVDKASGAHGTDPKRVYVAGFSAGAAMAVVLAATWPDVFSAAASFAGIPFDCGSSLTDVSSCMNPGKDFTAADWGQRAKTGFPSYAGPWPRVSIWQGTSDNVVGPNNRTQLARQWSNVHGLPETPSSTVTTDGQSHALWKDNTGQTVLETYAINGMSHGVPVVPSAGCGQTGQYAFDKGICGSRHVAEFFGLLGAPDAGAGH